MEHELSWIAPEYEFREKSVTWYWISILFAVLLIFIAVWQKNYLFGLVILVAEVLVILLGSKEPRLVEFKLNHKTLSIEGVGRYGLGEIEHWSVEEPPHTDIANIIIHFHRPFHLPLKIHIPKEMIPEFRKIVRFEAEELHRKESMVDVLEEFLGF